MAHKVAQCYLSQNCWLLAQAVEEFFNYREIFSEWKKSQLSSCQNKIENSTQIPLDSNPDMDQESNTSMPSLSPDYDSSSISDDN